jgi:hypothetical protein
MGESPKESPTDYTGLLKDKYSLQASPESRAAVRCTKAKTGQKVPEIPQERIQNYINRIKAIVYQPDGSKNERGFALFRQIVLDKFTTASQAERLDYIVLQVRDLGFTHAPTREELYARAEQWGLEIMPAEAGPLIALQQINNPPKNWFSIGMKPITGLGGGPSVFDVVPRGVGVKLDFYWGGSRSSLES